MTVAYLSINSNRHELIKQRENITCFAEDKGMDIDKWVSDIIRVRVTPRERYIDQLQRRMKEGDILIVSDVLRLGMSIGEVMRHLSNFMRSNISVYCVANSYVFDHTLNTEAMIRAFELMGAIDSTFASTPTR